MFEAGAWAAAPRGGEAPPVAVAETIPLVRLASGGQIYFLGPERIQRVERTDNLQRNPRGANPLGWLLDPAAEIPVFSLAERLFGDSAGAAPAGAVLVLAASGGSWGLMVDSLSRLPVEGPRILPFPRLAASAVGGRGALPFAGVVRTDGAAVLLLDGDRLSPFAAPPGVAAPAAAVSAVVSPLAAAAGTEGRILAFSAGLARLNGKAVRFALSLSQVVEVIGAPPLLEVPGATPFLLGLAVWRDRALPVVDLAAAIGLPPRTGAGRLLICRAPKSGALVALLVDPALTRHRLPLESRTYTGALPFSSDRILGCFELADELLIIPDLANLTL